MESTCQKKFTRLTRLASPLLLGLLLGSVDLQTQVFNTIVVSYKSKKKLNRYQEANLLKVAQKGNFLKV